VNLKLSQNFSCITFSKFVRKYPSCRVKKRMKISLVNTKTMKPAPGLASPRHGHRRDAESPVSGSTESHKSTARPAISASAAHTPKEKQAARDEPPMISPRATRSIPVVGTRSVDTQPRLASQRARKTNQIGTTTAAPSQLRPSRSLRDVATAPGARLFN
jgi:hypothetical protein